MRHETCPEHAQWLRQMQLLSVNFSVLFRVMLFWQQIEGSATMRRLIVFNMISLDGYFADENGDMNWAHSDRSNDAEFDEFVRNNAKGGGELLFGRKTYDLMAK